MASSANSSASSGSSGWEPPSVERLQELLPQYEITALIGRGGMGAVYKGVQTTLGRAVAIKLLPESLQYDAGDAGFVERFKLEARAMASLDHPAIISVFDFGQTSEGHLYFVMEFIDGMDLQQYLNASGGKLEADAVVAIISHVLDALDYAHKKGIVHRDIKPANVLINSEGRVKIADFGLAKQIGGEASGLTMSNVAMGTPDFIAPEAMLDSASSDGRADLYAVGVMLYQMLTGRLPRGMFKLPSEEDASFDPRFDDIIASALEPNPEFRFSAAMDFRKKLDELRTQPVSRVEGRSTIERRGAKTRDVAPAVRGGLPPRHVARKSGGGMLWAVVAVALLGGIAWLMMGRREDPTVSSREPVENSGINAVFTPTPPKPEPEPAAPPGDSPAKPSPATAEPVAGTNATTTMAPKPAVNEPAKPRIDGLVANGEWQDLMPGFTKASRIAVGGWSLTVPITKLDPSLHCMIGQATEPLSSYELRMKILHAGVQDADALPTNLNIAIPTASGTAKLFVEAIENRTALGSRNGKTLLDGGTFKPNPHGVFQVGKVQEWLFVMKSDSLSVSIDGLPFYEWDNADWSEFSSTGTLDPNEIFVGMMSGKSSRTEIHSFEIRIPPATNAGAPPPSIPAALADLPELRTRIANYQKARHQQLADLTGKYQKALVAAKAEASKAGNAANEKAIQQAITRAASHAAEIEKLPATKIVATLPALPALDEATPDALKKLRGIFDRESAKIEADLLGKLDQSLEALQTSMLETGDLEVVDALRAYRKTVIPASIAAPSPAPTQRNTTESRLTTATKDKPFKNSLGMKFVPVPGTDVLFCIHETRYKDYTVFASNEAGLDPSWKNQTLDGFTLTDRPEEHPVVNVSWDEAKRFCAWLGRKEGKIYRLPTDEEWSMAVGLGELENRPSRFTIASLDQLEVTHFPWGKQFPPTNATKIGNYNDQSRKAKISQGTARSLSGYDDGFPTTSPVMSFGPNSHGLFDMGGNVWEWCEDWYDSAKADRVMRGGSWLSSERASMLSSSRRHRLPDSHDKGNGFRVVLEPATLQSSGTLSLPNTPASDPSIAATKDDRFENSLGMKFVPVPITGGPTDGETVLFSIWETRLQDYLAFTKETGRSRTVPDYPQGDDHPVVNVTWKDAVAFCTWLTERERKAGGLPDGWAFRLPSDHEWSCAAGIGDQEDPSEAPAAKESKISNRYPWGTKWPPPSGVGNYNGEETVANPFDGNPIQGFNDGYARTAPVGGFPPNDRGIFDLSGNVNEWCEDFFSPTGRRRGLIRGSSWREGLEKFHLTSWRGDRPRDARVDCIGFRVVLDKPKLTLTPTPAADGRSHTSPGAIADELTNKSFEFRRVSGGAKRTVSNIKLLADGEIQGSSHRNETRWEMRNGQLVFIRDDGIETTVFTTAQQIGGKWRLEGEFLILPGTIHTLQER